MLRAEILFDKSSFCWTKDLDYNMIFIKRNVAWANDKLKYRGYIYLNEIYEAFGVEWDPLKENQVLIHTGEEYIKFEVADLTGNRQIIQVIW